MSATMTARSAPRARLEITLAVAGRVLPQLRRDHRTMAMLLVLPCLLMTLLWWMFDDSSAMIFDSIGPALLALFPFIIMFLVTSVTTLRERSSGTLERLLAMPMGKLDFLGGYALAFGLVAAVQSVLAVALSVGLLGLDVVGPVWLLTLVAVADAVLGTALGLFVSAFAQTEFQAVQFMPALVIPQILLCGLFVARDGPAAVPRGGQQRASAVVRRRRDADAHPDDRHRRRLGRPPDRGALRGRLGSPSALPRCGGVPRNLSPCPCSASRSSCSPAASRSRSSSARCRSPPGSSPAMSPARPPSPWSTPPPYSPTTASSRPSTSWARTPSTPSRPRPPSRPTSTCSSSCRPTA